MKGRIERIRGDILRRPLNYSDEGVIVGLRIIELLEQIAGEDDGGRNDGSDGRAGNGGKRSYHFSRKPVGR